MSTGSVYLRVAEYFLIEYLYDTYTPTQTKIKKYNNQNNNDVIVVNDYNLKNDTGNTEDLMFVDSGKGYKAIVDINEGFYYPNVDGSINSSVLPNGINLKYDTVRVHIRSGYNFQDSVGFSMEIFLQTISKTKLTLLSQAYFKGDLSVLKYNETPLRISEALFDKYIEYKILSSNSILDSGSQNNSYVNSNLVPVRPDRLIYCNFDIISSIDTTSGFIKFYQTNNDLIYIPIADNFNFLEPFIEESESYFTYCAKWNGELIENFIYTLNSKAGNKYHIEHEITIFEQRGESFYEVQRFNTIQDKNFATPFKIRPILTNSVDGSLQIEYVIKLYNNSDGSSITKKATLNSLNTNAYLEEPLRLNVENNPNFKVYNKVSRKNISLDNKKSLFDNKIIVPLYYNVAKVFVGSEPFSMKIVPFDNIYSINLVQEINAQEIPLEIEAGIEHQLVFIGNNGEKTRIKEHSTSEHSNGILNFLITKEQAEKIIYNGGVDFYINSYTDSYETNLAVGSWIEKGKEVEIPTIELPSEQNTSIIGGTLSQNDISILTNPVVVEILQDTVPIQIIQASEENINQINDNINNNTSTENNNASNSNTQVVSSIGNVSNDNASGGSTPVQETPVNNNSGVPSQDANVGNTQSSTPTIVDIPNDSNIIPSSSSASVIENVSVGENVNIATTPLGGIIPVKTTIVEVGESEFNDELIPLNNNVINQHNMNNVLMAINNANNLFIDRLIKQKQINSVRNNVRNYGHHHIYNYEQSVSQEQNIFGSNSPLNTIFNQLY